MATIKVKWLVEELANVMDQFDTQKVLRGDAEGGPFVEVTTPPTRIDFVVDQTLYYFDDGAGDSSKWYVVAYYNSISFEEEQSNPFQASQPGYVSLANVRAADVAEAAADDSTVLDAIKMWSDFIDRATRLFFEPRSLDVKLDGTDCRMLWLQVPIIGITSLYMNGEFTQAVNTNYYEAYNNLGNGLRDDRRDPKIALADLGSSDLYERLIVKGLFTKGRKNQRVVGTFGYVELDGTPPLLIKRAVLKLVVRQFKDDQYSVTPTPAGPIISETTDGHSIKYGSMFGGRKMGSVLVTGDAEVDGIIQYYRPKAMRVV